MTAPYDPHRTADGVNRADRGLRVFSQRIGHAVMCGRCQGDGLILRHTGWSAFSQIIEPFQCPVCNGEGLDPNARQGEER